MADGSAVLFATDRNVNNVDELTLKPLHEVGAKEKARPEPSQPLVLTPATSRPSGIMALRNRAARNQAATPMGTTSVKAKIRWDRPANGTMAGPRRTLVRIRSNAAAMLTAT